jgi:hypothetical protein
VLTLDGDIDRRDPLPPMHEARDVFACEAIGGCVIVAGGRASITDSRGVRGSARAVEAASLQPSLRRPSSQYGERVDVISLDFTTTK